MRKYFLTLFLLVGLIEFAPAQKSPVKFGEISKAELLNTIYAPDSSAPAVVLCDYGYYSEKDFQTVRILRVKILKKEGYLWANQTFNSNDKTNIRGITFNLEGNEIVKTKLKSESVFKTKIIENYYEIRVAMPNVKVGSVIDIEFTYDGIPYEWNFQQEIPVVYSELVLEPSTYVKFNKNYFGYIPLNVSTNNHWVASDVPAFKPEPFMTSSKDYRTRLEFDIEEISTPGYTRYYNMNGVTYKREFLGHYQAFTASWESIRKLLFFTVDYGFSMGYLTYLYEHFGLPLKTDTYLNEIVKDLKSQFLTRDETIKAAYEYTKHIKWDKTNRFLSKNSFLSNSYKEKNGNSADINLALVQLLRRLGLNAGPVIMSTRSNGRLSEMHPSINKLNYVIAAVFTENDTLLLDATEENCPYYLLPIRALNGQAQFMDETKSGWVQLVAAKKDKQMDVYSLSIGDDMSVKGNLTFLKGDYAALDFRNDYEKFNSDDEYLAEFVKDKKGIKVISHKIDNLDSLYKPINEEFQIVSNNSVSEIDGELYIIPLLFEQIRENPFRVSTREYPIDFGYAREKTIIVNYTIPNGYTIANMPANVSLKLAENAAFFSCKSSVTEGRLTLIYKFNINSSIFLQTQYADLREFYNQVIVKHAEPIVLKKI